MNVSLIAILDNLKQFLLGSFRQFKKTFLIFHLRQVHNTETLPIAVKMDALRVNVYAKVLNISANKVCSNIVFLFYHICVF